MCREYRSRSAKEDTYFQKQIRYKDNPEITFQTEIGFNQKRMKKVLVVVGLAQLLIFSSCGPSDEKKTVKADKQLQEEAALSGEQLSLMYCQSCHLYPEPATLDKHTWERSVLPLMGRLFGVYEENVPRSEILSGAINKKAVLEQNIFPVNQSITDEQWNKIVDFYISSAPEPSKSAANKDTLFVPIEQFEAITPHLKKPISTTLVKIDQENSLVYLGESKDKIGAITILNKDFEVINSINLPTPPTDINFTKDSLALTLAGSLRLAPSGNRFGELVYIFRTPGEQEYSFFTKFYEKLNRPVETVFEDINGNGYQDMLIAEFGYYTGSLTLYENGGGKKQLYKKTILKNAPGAIKSYVRDMNMDGHKDIITLFAQGDEGISIFYNNGEGGFKEERILRFNPSYGSVYFELVDFNNDGFTDILYCNGDNGDYPPVLKNYHGLRIFENDGNNNFENVYFFPMDGANKCSAEDFDRDGDLDIIAISFFPDVQATQRRDVVYLKNNGKYSFSPQYLPQQTAARWLTFDIADLDGNGYKDIILGASGRFKNTRKDPGVQQEESSLLFLKNIGK
jgi:hypothetical protein